MDGDDPTLIGLTDGLFVSLSMLDGVCCFDASSVLSGVPVSALPPVMNPGGSWKGARLGMGGRGGFSMSSGGGKGGGGTEGGKGTSSAGG